MILIPRKHEVNYSDYHVSAANTFKYVWNVMYYPNPSFILSYREDFWYMNCVYVNRDIREVLFYCINRKYFST